MSAKEGNHMANNEGWIKYDEMNGVHFYSEKEGKTAL
jgi:hypothetical protein